MPAAEQTTDY